MEKGQPCGRCERPPLSTCRHAQVLDDIVATVALGDRLLRCPMGIDVERVDSELTGAFCAWRGLRAPRAAAAVLRLAGGCVHRLQVVLQHLFDQRLTEGVQTLQVLHMLLASCLQIVQRLHMALPARFAHCGNVDGLAFHKGLWKLHVAL